MLSKLVLALPGGRTAASHIPDRNSPDLTWASWIGAASTQPRASQIVVRVHRFQPQTERSGILVGEPYNRRAGVH